MNRELPDVHAGFRKGIGIRDQIASIRWIIEKAREILLNKYPQRIIELFNTSNFSIGHGIISYCLAIKYRNGAKISELVEFGERLKKEYSTYFILDNANNLIENALLDSKNVVNSALSIKPIVSIDINGNFNIVDKVSGKKKE